MPSKRRGSIDEDDEHETGDTNDLEVGQAPTEINPYDVLGLETSASADDIKKAYHKAALRHHPDKVSADQKPAAHAKFQEIAFAYAILSDARRRKRFDLTGRTEESLDLDDDEFDWTSFYREQFAEAITEEKVAAFAATYRGSAEEREHLLDAYTQFEGRMSKIYESVMLSDMVRDEERFRKVIDEAIAEGEVEAFEKYTGESSKARAARISKAKKAQEDEAEEVAELAEKIKAKQGKGNQAGKEKKGNGKKDESGGMGDLAAMIQNRQKGREQDFFANLEAKYAGKSKKGKIPKRKMEEPPEEAFAANRKKTKTRH